jgi:hypothetical protein
MLHSTRASVTLYVCWSCMYICYAVCALGVHCIVLCVWLIALQPFSQHCFGSCTNILFLQVWSLQLGGKKHLCPCFLHAPHVVHLLTNACVCAAETNTNCLLYAGLHFSSAGIIEAPRNHLGILEAPSSVARSRRATTQCQVLFMNSRRASFLSV